MPDWPFLFSSVFLPIALGALIGWVTNAVAIKMLFRPLRELRVLGLRLPFTPGVIPRQRRRLAESIARMVSRELLTPELLARQTEREAFRAGLRRGVAGLTARLLEWRPLGDGRPEQAEPAVAFIVESLERLIPKLVESEQFAAALEKVAAGFASRAAGIPLAELALEDGRLKDGPRRILETALDLLSGPGPRRALQEALRRARADGASAGAFLGGAERRFLVELAGRAYPFLVGRVMDWLEDADTRAMLVERGRAFAREAAGEFSTLQRLVMSAGGYERTLEERMPALVDRLVRFLGETLRGEAARRELLGRLERELEAAARLGLPALEQRYRFDAEKTCEALLLGAGAWLKRPMVRVKLAGALEDLLGRSAGTDLLSALEKLTGRPGPEMIGYFAGGLLAWFRRGAREFSGLVAGGARAWLTGRAGVRLGEMLEVDAAAKDSLDGFLAGGAAGLIAAEMPGLIGGFDVEDLVIKRIDGLEVEQVEKLLLEVIARHLTWINFFGAILGGLIGGLQTLMAIVK